jgi:NAD(P)-dependent dehydrogenase (short-subunit alcohol dehydrogenase family)
VNLVGQVAVTQAFLPMIRKVPGTIVFIASIGGRIASPFMSPYNTSKFAVEALGESLRQELSPWGIDVAVIEPGSIDTPIWSKGAETIDDQKGNMSPTETRLYRKQLDRMEEVLSETANRGIPPEKVAKVIHEAIRSEKPKHRYLVGRDARIAARLKGTLPDRAFKKLIDRQIKMPTDVPAK